MPRLVLVAIALALLGGLPSGAQEPEKADATVEGFLTAIKRGDFKAAASHFDANLKAALPPTELASVWKSKTGSFGALTSWTTVEHAMAGGKDVRLVALKFAHGEMQTVLSITPSTRELAGISFPPAPAPAPGPAPAPAAPKP